MESGASDVHVAVGFPITLRVDGDLVPFAPEKATLADVEEIVKAMLGESDWQRLQKEREVDSSYMLANGTRLRINCHFERSYPSFVARIIPDSIPTMEELRIPQIAKNFCFQEEGLILFTGPTGSGKSTTMAALIENIRANRNVHIVTLEDPIEFLFPPQEKGIIRQRQFGEDFLKFDEAMRRVLRQDPDVVMVGEMRDLESIAAALTLAETGHLVFATLHTPNSTQSIDRIVDVFPPHQQGQIRSQLSLSLKAIFAQRLLPKVGGGQIAMREVLVNTPAVANTIRESRTQELASVLQMGAEGGMITFEQDAKALLKEHLISEETFRDAIGVIKSMSEARRI